MGEAVNDVFATSIPKAGSHLLYHILGFSKYEGKNINGILKFKEGWYGGHIGHNPQLHSNKVRIFLRRHPGDILVSWAHFLEKTKGQKDNPFNLRQLAEQGLDVLKAKDKLNFLLTYLKPFIEGFTGWMEEPIYKLRYEDLLTKPREVLAPVAVSLGCSLDTMVDRSKFRGGMTFRTGRIGDWKDEFKPHHLKKFKRGYAEILDTFEYSVR